MVKNLPTVERSTKIRFGKHVPDSADQADNTIVFNASDTMVTTPNSEGIYMAPVRYRADYDDPNIVLMMYNRETHELSESGERASALVGGVTLQIATQRGNVTSNTVVFTGTDGDRGISLMTSNAVGIANLFPEDHTLSVGSNLYINDTGSNVLVVSGDASILKDLTVEGNLTVCGDTSVFLTENISIRDALIEVGRNNTSTDTTLDLGLLMHRPDPDSNVIVGFRESTDELVIAYTDAKPTDKSFTPKSDEDINVHVYGLTHVDANIYAHEDLILSGNAYVSGNVEVTKALIVSGNTHLKGDNVFITHTMDFLDPTTAIVTDQISNVQIRLGQLENVSNLASNPHENQVLRYVGSEWSNDYPQQNFMRVKNGYSEEDGRTLYKGNTVYVSATQNAGLVQVKAAQSHVASEMPCVGLVYEDIPPEGEGVVLTYGVLTNLKTTHLTAGGTVYVSNVYSGYHTSVKPDDDVAASPDLIQNLGICTRSHDSSGAIFVTGIGRANDIPNAELITDYNNMQYVYVNNTNNDLKKITSANLNIPLTTAVSSSSNSAANAVTLRGLSITSGDGFHGDIVAAGNVTVDTNTFKVDAEANRVGLGTTNPTQTLDVRGSISTDDYLIHNGDTNTKIGFSGDDTFVVNTNGNEQVKVGADGNVYITSNLIVDTSTLFVHSENNRVGILTASPGQPLDVRGAANVGALTTTSASVTDTTHSTSKDTGVLIVTNGGLGVEANIHSTNVFAASHIAVGTSATTKALDVRGTSNVGIFTTPDATVTDSTAATSTSTGALKVVGGAGIQGDLYANDGHFTADVSVGSLTNKYIPYANSTKILTDSILRQEITTPANKLVVAGDIEITGNLLVQGEQTVIENADLIVQDRIIDIANNNTDHDLDIGILMEHPGYNLGLILHGTHPHDLSIGYTQNGYSDTHILRDVGNVVSVNVWGNVLTQNCLVVNENISIIDGGLGINVGDGRTSDHLGGKKLYVDGDIQIGKGTANLFVNTDTKRVGIMTNSPGQTLDVRGSSNVGVFTTPDASVTDTTVAKSTITGALKVSGGISTQDNVYVGRNVFITSNLNVDTNTLHVDSQANRVGIGKTDPTVALDVVGDSISTGTVKGATLTGTNLYGTISGANTAAVSTLIASDTVKGATLTGTNLYGTISGSNTAAVSDLTATGTVKGATLTGTNLYGTISGSNTAAVSDLTATGTVKGATLTGTNLYGTISGSNTAAVSDLTATGTVKGATLTGTNLYGTISGSNTAAVSDLTATGTVKGATLTGTNLYGTISGSNAATVTTLTASEVVDITDTTVAYSTSTGALKVAGGISTQDNVYVGRNVFITSNLNVDGTTLHVDSVANRVGIGKTDPTVALDVAGAATISGVTSVTDSTASTSKGDGALVVSGGVGITGDIYAADATFDNLSVAADTDITGTIGRAKVGYVGYNDYAGFAHYDQASAGNYGFLQGPNGDTFVNSSTGQPITFKENNVNKMTLTSGDLGIGTGSPGNKLHVLGDSVAVTSDPSVDNYGQIELSSSSYAGWASADRPTNLKIGIDHSVGTLGAGFIQGVIDYISSNIPLLLCPKGGNVGIGTDSPTTKLHVAGGTIINSDRVAKKTYSYYGQLNALQSVANSTIKITFSNHVFYAKVVAHLVDGSGENVSTLSFECGGGKWDGTAPSNNIAIGPLNIFGASATNPWDPVLTKTSTTVAFKPTNDMAAAGHYNVFIEYISQSSSGVVTKITEGTTDQITFNY